LSFFILCILNLLVVDYSTSVCATQSRRECANFGKLRSARSLLQLDLFVMSCKFKLLAYEHRLCEKLIQMFWTLDTSPTAHNGNVSSILHCFSNKQEAQLSLGKADRNAYFRSPASDFQSWRENDFSEMAPFHARCVKGTLLLKATINDSITHVARGHFAS